MALPVPPPKCHQFSPASLQKPIPVVEKVLKLAFRIALVERAFLPIGLASHDQWLRIGDRKLCPAVKAEIGVGSRLVLGVIGAVRPLELLDHTVVGEVEPIDLRRQRFDEGQAARINRLVPVHQRESRANRTCPWNLRVPCRRIFRSRQLSTLSCCGQVQCRQRSRSGRTLGLPSALRALRLASSPCPPPAGHGEPFVLEFCDKRLVAFAAVMNGCRPLLAPDIAFRRA